MIWGHLGSFGVIWDVPPPNPLPPTHLSSWGAAGGSWGALNPPASLRGGEGGAAPRDGTSGVTSGVTSAAAVGLWGGNGGTP